MSSAMAMMALIVYAFRANEQIYPTLVYLSQSKTSILLTGNMTIACAILVGKIFKTIFFGSLRSAEIEMLYERAKYSITETCLALTVFRSEISPTILVFFGSMIFVKAFHWLAKSRLEYNEQVQPLPIIAHCRMVAVITILMIVDVSVARYCVNYTFDQGRSIFILFGFEFGLLVIDIFNLMLRYIINCIDAYNENGFHSKGVALMLIDLLADALRFITYSFFFCLVFVYYGLPIHIVREVWMSFLAFQSKLASFIKYLQLNHNLDQRFDDATAEELASAGICLICFEPMSTGKKLPPPCGHVFHLNCLRGWFQYRQDCPTCRRDIPMTTSRSTRANAAAAHALERQDARDNGEQAGNNAVQAAPTPTADNNTATGGSSRGGGATAPSSSSPSDAITSDEPEFPAFYRVTSPQACEVRIAPSISSFTIRNLSNQVVVLALEKYTDDSGDRWLHIPDGWIYAGRAEGLTHEAEDYVEIFMCAPGQTLETAKRTKRNIERAKATKKAEKHRSLLPQSATCSIVVDGKSSASKITATGGSVSRVNTNSWSTDPILYKLDALDSQLAQMSDMLYATQDMVKTLREEHLSKKNTFGEIAKFGEKIQEMSQVFGDDNNIYAAAEESSIRMANEMMTEDEEEEAIRALLDVNDEVMKLGEQEPLKRVKSGESPSLKQEGKNEEEEKVDGRFPRQLSTEGANGGGKTSSPSLREMRAKFFASSSGDAVDRG